MRAQSTARVVSDVTWSEAEAAAREEVVKVVARRERVRGRMERRIVVGVVMSVGVGVEGGIGIEVEVVRER